MKVGIIEDEVIAARTLEHMIREIRPEITVAARLATVEESVEWFRQNPQPELLFMDIHLADGSSFAIFEQVEIRCPVIFTTAYNEYALEAFEVNGIDYLLKPINKPRLNKALAKFSSLGAQQDYFGVVEKLLETIQGKQNRRKTHFLVPPTAPLAPWAVGDIAYFYADMKIAKAVTFGQRTFSLDYSLEELMKHLDAEEFFRVNRQYIV
ncbi:MAG: LytTR family DNA-binding domain-containing protein, partial [Rikenellaceae bacterium]|nr:LytTR family DNA-binding domain-containing protein [Rikenellaceae bacterium]